MCVVGQILIAGTVISHSHRVCNGYVTKAETLQLGKGQGRAGAYMDLTEQQQTLNTRLMPNSYCSSCAYLPYA